MKDWNKVDTSALPVRKVFGSIWAGNASMKDSIKRDKPLSWSLWHANNKYKRENEEQFLHTHFVCLQSSTDV